MSYTTGYLKFLLERFKKCERRLTSVKPAELERVRKEVMEGNELMIQWVKSVLAIYEYDFKPEMKELKEYLKRKISKSNK